MKVLLTGASSFTGYWFAEALAKAGAQVVAPLTAGRADYAEGARAQRVARLGTVAEIVEHAPFGSERFLDLAGTGGFDLLCHHAARVGDYRSPDFDVAGALAENTHNLRPVLGALARGGLKGVVLTGSVFEQDEGAGEEPRVAFSPYGLSKGLTATVVEHRCREIGLRYGKFVIPNPFGPLEEPRFCSYLIRTWREGKAARVNTPDYVRDNIHVSLLASAYARFASAVEGGGPAVRRLNPSGYVERQGAFAQRFAAAMRERLGWACGVELGIQSDFSEPLMRVNTDSAFRYVGAWDEVAGWDAIAEFYHG
ncbi:NAD-dependent epimerase/dehydratase family protein [Ancylobacter amanitiformis]|uniref:Nucleoside-diphosphate-sugar epimerase n=1 Tax=Ancylobacter amanitiformis TaxID=217069 RepID=A0ABU0LTZ0_9HYPH|nr:NAD(P)-dependent oxidoreductase [Ancylobacter amanitiformis]MDQ0512171.1 nucleoside-diphosphate-sugar epimerase [Ancylobacter amanitiformis]